MKLIIEQLLNQQDLTQKESRDIMRNIMSGKYDDAQIAGFLIAMRSKGETSIEIAGFAEAMKEKMTTISISDDAIDMCGTGGDASGTFNISTAASFVVAGAGVKVAKHGNRSMTSKSGSADVLESLGVNINHSPKKVTKCIETFGLGFMFAPALHPAMKYAMGARKSLAIRTVFNILGPLCNPADVKRQVMGIFDGNLTVKIAHVLKILGSKHAIIVHGDDGLDEISTTSNTQFTELIPSGDIKSGTISPSDFNINKSNLKALKGGTPDFNAKIIQNILNGKKGVQRDIVILNAAAGIKVGGKANSIDEGIKLAEEAIDSGLAKNVLKSLINIK
jgi:anthranilate phosphoribosyltransferase